MVSRQEASLSQAAEDLLLKAPYIIRTTSPGYGSRSSEGLEVVGGRVNARVFLLTVIKDEFPIPRDHCVDFISLGLVSRLGLDLQSGDITVYDSNDYCVMTLSPAPRRASVIRDRLSTLRAQVR